MQPAFGDEIERAAGGNVVAEVDLDIMIARDSLILAATEGVEIVSVERAQGLRYVVAVVVDGADDGMRRCR